MPRLPFFSNSDRRALLILEWILFLVVLGIAIWSWCSPGMFSDENAQDLQDCARQKRNPVASLTYAVPEQKVETFPFDPNTADSTTLLRLGLSPWQVRSIYKYRSMHGRYHEPSDFKRVPGMTHELWERLGPFVRIDRKFQYLTPKDYEKPVRKSAPAMHRSDTDTLNRQTIPSVSPVPRDTILQPIKYPEGTQIDLNRADTNQLKKIPGIASYRASKIVEYRTLLGGFMHVEQVMEACEMPDDVMSWFYVEPIAPSRLQVNKMSLQRLMRHPYITFYQARAIVEHRRMVGLFSNAEELLQLKEFKPEDLERLKDYLDFSGSVAP